MNKRPDVLGMKMPAAVEILDAAGISHNEEISAPVKMGRHGDDAVCERPMRVIRQKWNEDGTATLTVCEVPDPDPAEQLPEVKAETEIH